MLSTLQDLGSSALIVLPTFIIVLSVVIFIHELGHFLVARWCGVRVLTFSMGFGPELWHRIDRRGTRWRIAAVPLGGYVKFFGDENAASAPDREALGAMRADDRKVSFFGQPVHKRAAIVAAGPIANFVLTIAIFTASFYFLGRPVTEARVDTIVAGSAAEAAGFQVGDVIVAIDGTEIEGFGDMQRLVRISPDEPLTFTVRRDGQQVNLVATPRRQEVRDNFGQTHRIGILGVSRSDTSPADIRHKSYGPVEAFVSGIKETWFVVDRTFAFIGGLIAGTESPDQLTGPIGIAKVSGQAAQMGVEYVVHLIAVLSVSIGLLNLFPIPLLDGGHLMYYAVEAVRGRPLSEKAQEFGFRIGIALILTLMIFATWNDLFGRGMS